LYADHDLDAVQNTLWISDTIQLAGYIAIVNPDAHSLFNFHPDLISGLVSYADHYPDAV
jgi:hypothetical protein